MATTDLSRQAREILVQFRNGVTAREQAATAAQEALRVEQVAAAQAELSAHDEARSDRDAAEGAAAAQRASAENAAAATLQDARRRAAAHADGIRAAWSGADTALGLADLRQLHAIAQERVTPITEAPAGTNPERELARCATEAAKAARRIDTGVQQALTGRGSGRRLFPRLALAAAVAIGSAVLLFQQAMQPCGFLRSIAGRPASCAHPAKHTRTLTSPITLVPALWTPSQSEAQPLALAPLAVPRPGGGAPI